ncbi:MAG: hypothetical protein ACREH4_08685 [Vitreimonas sp.]
MAQPVTAILSHQEELAAKAKQFTQDTNEAGLLVGRVVSQALQRLHEGAPEELIASGMRRDLDQLIEKMRRAQVY